MTRSSPAGDGKAPKRERVASLQGGTTLSLLRARSWRHRQVLTPHPEQNQQAQLAARLLARGKEKGRASPAAFSVGFLAPPGTGRAALPAITCPVAASCCHAKR